MMTRIKAIFEGKEDDLKTALVFCIHYASIKKIVGNRLFITWICETEVYETALTECMECVDLDALFNVDLVSIG